MSMKLSAELSKKIPKQSKNDSSETKRKFEENYEIEEDFWRDCLASKDTNFSKNVSENDKTRGMKSTYKD